jgi:hypothetical protein
MVGCLHGGVSISLPILDDGGLLKGQLGDTQCGLWSKGFKASGGGCKCLVQLRALKSFVNNGARPLLTKVGHVTLLTGSWS